MDKPQLTLLKKGDIFKIYQVTGPKDAKMPKHLSTKEAVMIIEEGSAIFTINEKDNVLKTSDSFIIPGGVSHTLLITEKLKALVIMPNESEIEFIIN